jgi:hypothetical protein
MDQSDLTSEEKGELKSEMKELKQEVKECHLSVIDPSKILNV